MKAKLLFAIGSVCVIWGQPSSAGVEEEAALRAEVAQVAKAFMQACERVDFEATIKFEGDVPDYLYADVDGQMYEYRAFRELVSRSFAGSLSQKVTTRREKFIVLGADVVLWAWNGAVEIKAKDGGVVRIDPYSATFVVKKLGSGWRIIYQHESGLPPSGPVAPPPLAK